MSDLYPTTTSDERDPREDKNDEAKREEELQRDKPPHHS